MLAGIVMPLLVVVDKSVFVGTILQCLYVKIPMFVGIKVSMFLGDEGI